MSAAEDPRLQAWLRRFRWSLSRMPEAERNDLVEETRAHILDRVNAGASLDEALTGFGAAEAYGRQFIDEMELTTALASRSSKDLLAVVVRRVHHSLVAAAAFVVILILGAFTAGVVMTALNKLADPEHWGVWVGGGDFFIGQIDNVAGHTELLGGWIYLLAIASVTVAWVLGRLVLLWAARTLRGR